MFTGNEGWRKKGKGKKIQEKIEEGKKEIGREGRREEGRMKFGVLMKFQIIIIIGWKTCNGK